MLWGIDLGGTKIETVVLDENLNTLVRERVPTQAQKGMAHIISQVQRVLEIAAKKLGQPPSAVGIGTPGSTDPKSGLLYGSNTQAINGRPFLSEVRRALGIPVLMENDANCFALAEATMGAAFEQGAQGRVVFGVILGTGVGGGIVIDGRLLPGRHGAAGEWGHTFLDDSGGPCYCGDHGCVETILAGPSLERFYERLAGERRDLKEIDARARSGMDVHAERTMERLVSFFGLGLSNVINTLDPDVVVLGGGLSQLDVLYEAGREAVRKHTFYPTAGTPILRPRLGDSAGVYGAALLCRT